MVISLPTEPIGIVSRPDWLIEAMTAHTSVRLAHSAVPGSGRYLEDFIPGGSGSSDTSSGTGSNGIVPGGRPSTPSSSSTGQGQGPAPVAGPTARGCDLAEGPGASAHPPGPVQRDRGNPAPRRDNWRDAAPVPT